MSEKKSIFQHTVLNVIEKKRLSDYAIGIFPTLPSRKSVKKAIKKGLILVDGEIAQSSLWVREGMVLILLEEKKTLPKAFPMMIDVMHEDDHLAVVIKPAGIPVNGNFYRTVENALHQHLQSSKSKDALSWPKPVHRLDQQTMGLLLIAKTSNALVKLGQFFEQKKISKTYFAIVKGKMPSNGIIENNIKGKPAITRYRTIKHVRSLRNEWISLVEVRPETGRTHQIRIHLSDAGFPIVGDRLYSPNGTLKGKGLFLCAANLALPHPLKPKTIEINLFLPLKFERFLQLEERRWKKFNLSRSDQTYNESI